MRTRAGVFAAWLLVAWSAAVACSPGSQPPSPDLTVFQWMQAYAGQDGITVARLTCRANQAETQNTRLLSMALGAPVPAFGGGGGGQFPGGGGGQIGYDVSDLRYATTFADDQTARVQVTGLLRLVSGAASQTLSMNTLVGLIREQELWRVCDTPGARG